MYYQTEHTLVRFNHQKENVELSLRSEQVLQEMTEEYGATNWSVFIGFPGYVGLILKDQSSVKQHHIILLGTYRHSVLINLSYSWLLIFESFFHYFFLDYTGAAILALSPQELDSFHTAVFVMLASEAF